MTFTGLAPGAPAADRPIGHSPTEARQSTVWLVAAAFAAIFSSSRQPLTAAGLALSLTVMGAAVLSGNRNSTSVTSQLPAGFTLLVSWAMIWGLVGGSAPWGAWGTRGAALTGAAIWSAATCLGCRSAAQRVVLIGREASALVGSTLLAMFLAGVIAFQPFAWWSRINSSGTDFLRHIGFTRDLMSAGELSPGVAAYPQSLHALCAWLAAVLDVNPSPAQLWKVLAALTFLMLVLMLLAVMSIATRLTDLVHGRAGRPGAFAAGVAMVIFLQTAWFDTFLAYGSVMNMLVALCLLAIICSGLAIDSHRNTHASLIGGSAIAVAANSWQLILPAVGLAATPYIVGFVVYRRSSVRDWAIWLLAALLALNGLAALREVPGDHTATQTVSNLFNPEWWWGVGLALALGALVTAFRLRPWWSSMGFGGVIGGMGLTAWLFFSTGSTWELMRYYPVKAMWTAMVLVIPLASAGGLLLLHRVWWCAPRRPLAQPVLRGVAVAVVAIAGVGSLGRGMAFRPHLQVMAMGRSSTPNWPMAMLASLSNVEIAQERKSGAIVFGLVPEANLALARGGYVGMVDYMAMEALRFLDIPDAFSAPVKSALATRDMTQVCRYLKDHPHSLRLTGPNLAAGPEWIVASGCPASVVYSSDWTSVEIAPVWLERSTWEGASAPWDFPTVAEVRGPVANG